ncbi:MAG: class I SAM-dependent methyltransferase [Calditrichaceae bacterium]|nr:class I SAM-dependent methyltransferase [Calditrichaceae bacterium]
MFDELEKINHRPKPFEFYTTEELWTNEYTSQKMLEFHLNESIDVSSRNINFINHSAEWIRNRYKLDESKSVCDFGCGPGLYTTRFAETGAQVTGIDFSKRSIDYAEKTAAEKNLNIKYLNQNYLKFDTGERYDLITMIMCDYCALSPDQRKQMLKKFRKLLKPDGYILLDVYTLEAFNQREEQTIFQPNLLDGFWSPEKYYGFLNTIKYNEEKVILDKYTIIEKNKTSMIYNWLQYFSKSHLIAEFGVNGFKVENVFADVAGSNFNPKATEMAVAAIKQV